MKKRVLLSALGAVLFSASLALATGYFPGFPQKGGPSYCGGYYNNGSTPTCNSTVPAGSTSFSGNEAVPFDDYGPITSITSGSAAGSGAPPATEFVSILQLGNGGFQNLLSTTSSTTVTVLPTTSVMFENATVTNPTITFTAAPLQGQLFTLVWGANLTTGLTTAAGAGSTCLPACGAIAVTTAGTTHKWIYEGTIWYQIQ